MMRILREQTKTNGAPTDLQPIKKYPPHRQWIAKIKTSQGLKTIGTFPTAIEAAVAYNAMAIKHFGEFARLNPV